MAFKEDERRAQPRTSMRFRPYGLAGLLVSVIFVYLAVRKVDLLESLRVLRSLDLRWVVASMLVYLLLALPIRGLRWRLILREQKLLTLKEVLVPIYVGYMA